MLFRNLLSALLDLLAIASALSLPLYLWQVWYPSSDWAVLALVPLFWMMVQGNYKVIILRRRAALVCMLRPGSILTRILKGRIIAACSACLITGVTIPLLAYKALTADGAEIALLALLLIIAVLIIRLLSSFSKVHFNDSFLPSVVSRCTTVLSGLLFLPIYYWFVHDVARIPGYMRSLRFPEAISMALDSLPVRDGWMAETLAAFHALENAKLWAVVNLGNDSVIFLIYAIYSTLICFFFASAIVSVASFYGLMVKGNLYGN